MEIDEFKILEFLDHLQTVYIKYLKERWAEALEFAENSIKNKRADEADQDERKKYVFMLASGVFDKSAMPIEKMWTIYEYLRRGNP